MHRQAQQRDLFKLRIELRAFVMAAAIDDDNFQPLAVRGGFQGGDGAAQRGGLVVADQNRRNPRFDDLFLRFLRDFGRFDRLLSFLGVAASRFGHQARGSERPAFPCWWSGSLGSRPGVSPPIRVPRRGFPASSTPERDRGGGRRSLPGPPARRSWW